MTKFKLLTLPFLMLAFLSVLVTSCSKEEETTIEGLWTASSITVDGEEAIGVDIDTYYLDFGTHNGTQGSITFTFTLLGGDTDSAIGTYIINENTKVVSVTIDSETTDFTYAINGNQLTLSGTDSDGVVIVIVATK